MKKKKPTAISRQLRRVSPRKRQTARASALSAISAVMLGAWALRRRAA